MSDILLFPNIIIIRSQNIIVKFRLFHTMPKKEAQDPTLITIIVVDIVSTTYKRLIFPLSLSYII